MTLATAGWSSPLHPPPELIAALRKQGEARGLRDHAGGKDYQKLRAATDPPTDSARALDLPEFPVEFATVHADLADWGALGCWAAGPAVASTTIGPCPPLT